MSKLLDDPFLNQTFAALERAYDLFAGRHPGDTGERQPIHTLYGGAQLYQAGCLGEIRKQALEHFQLYAPGGPALASALGQVATDPLWETIHERVTRRLETCAVEDYRIDFEDGYGNRPDSEEDATAAAVARAVATDMASGSLPPFFGIRLKSFSNEQKRRAARTLGIFLSTLLDASDGQLPQNFVVTLPKVVIPEQVAALVTLLERLEVEHQLAPGMLRLEIMVETMPAVLDHDGTVPLRRFVAAARGRCRGSHFGTYDYTASCDITAAQQRMDHPACDFALNVMKVALAGSGVWLSNGSTGVLPVPGPGQVKDNQAGVHNAWRTSYGHITHSLVNGFYQGWDLHPTQLGVRYAACYAFFLAGLPAASARLGNFLEKAAQATLLGDVFDDVATGQALLNFFLRALNSGAITDDAIKATGLTLAEVRSRSFAAILAQRAKDSTN